MEVRFLILPADITSWLRMLSCDKPDNRRRKEVRGSPSCFLGEKMSSDGCAQLMETYLNPEKSSKSG
jgi:hypothetical protein